MNEKFPTRESTPVAGDSTEHFEAVFSEKNTGESVQDSHQAEFDSGLSAPESKEAGNNQPETGRGRDRNARRGGIGRPKHNRKRAANYEAGRNNKDSQEQAEESQGKGKPLKEASELAFERGNESMAQQEKQRRQREYEYMEATDGGAKPEAAKQPEQNEQANTAATKPADNETLPDDSDAEVVIPTQKGPRTVQLNGTIGINKNGERIFAIAGNGGAVAESDFKTKEPEQNNASDSSREQNNQNASQVASSESESVASAEPDMESQENTQIASDGKTVSEQGEPEKEPEQENSEASTDTESLMQALRDRFIMFGDDKFEEIFEGYIQKLQEQGMSAEEARAAAPAMLASKIGTITEGQENGESSTGTKSSIDIDIDRVVRQYQHEGMSLEDARAAAVDLAARIEGGPSNSRTAESSELPNYAANQANTTFSSEGDMNWYSPATYEAAEYNTTGSSNSTYSAEQNESEEKDITAAEKTRRFADNVKRKSLIAFDNFAFRTRREARKYLTPLEPVYNLAKSETARRRIATTAIGSLAIFGTYVGSAENFQNSGESEEDKTTNTPEVANDEPDISESYLAAGIGGLAENISSSIPGKEDIEEHTGVTIDETEDGRGYEVKAMAGTSGEELLEEVDNFANRIAKERLKWDIEDISIAKPLLETAGFDVENLNDNIDDARTFVIDTEAVRKAALKVAKESPSGVWDTVNSLAG